jgi:hypothetical protein
MLHDQENSADIHGADVLRKQPRTTLAGPLNRGSWPFPVSLVNDRISDCRIRHLRGRLLE